jgi:hypothetical protein
MLRTVFLNVHEKYSIWTISIPAQQWGRKVKLKMSSCERGENDSLIVHCITDGSFIPPALFFKGARNKKGILWRTTSRIKVYMNKRSSFIRSELFFIRLQEYFAPRKPPSEYFLILGGHYSHKNARICSCPMLNPRLFAYPGTIAFGSRSFKRLKHYLYDRQCPRPLHSMTYK